MTAESATAAPVAPPSASDELLHTRTYDVQVYRRTPELLLVTGRVVDTKPPGLYVADDPDALILHDMTVLLEVATPAMVVTAADARFNSHPHLSCPSISAAYGQLVGVSVTRGFVSTVNERFGGPRGCAHITALLRAMGPPIIQAMWSVRVQSRDEPAVGAADPSQLFRASLNSCHVWADDGDHVASLRRGESAPIPLQVSRRLGQLGRDPQSWPEGGR